jgi:hypothetical protein
VYYSGLEEVLSEDRKVVRSSDIEIWLGLSQAGKIDMADPHASGADCVGCHRLGLGKTFTVIGRKKFLGAFTRSEINMINNSMTSWMESGFLGVFYGQNSLFCRACHNENLISDSPETHKNWACMKYRGSLDKIASIKKDCINPYNPHLKEIACMTCHRDHTPSTSYCSNRHTLSIKIQGDTLDTKKKGKQRPVAAAPDIAVPKNIHFEKTDIMAIGSVAARLVAAITARDIGTKIVVLKKQPITGGNSVLAADRMNAADIKFQKKRGITSSPDRTYKDKMTGGKHLNDPALPKVFAEKSIDSVEQLTKLRADLSDIGRPGETSVDRAHKSKGETIVSHIFNGQIHDNLKQFESYQSNLVKQDINPKGLAGKIKVPPQEAMKTTINNYNGFYASNADLQFKHPDIPLPIEAPNYYAIKIAPDIIR